jgi:hypothetical protein
MYVLLNLGRWLCCNQTFEFICVYFGVNSVFAKRINRRESLLVILPVGDEGALLFEGFA